ncbi:Hypothetical protein D9617_17g046720 [Elsinoe fawcettii]|nr:Hypothetical protein D9617_17g046720 [Elsinoe fawcettii]
MRLTSFLLLLSWSTDYASGFTLGRRADRQTQEEFNGETVSFEKQGLCRSYKSAGGDTLGTCRVYCNKQSNITCFGLFEGVSGREMTVLDPEGRLFSMGRCECKVPEIAVFLATEILEAMPLVAGIGCTILFGALQTVIDIGTTLIPGGAAVKGVEKGVQAAKTLVENGNDAAGFTGWFSKVCNPTNSDAVAKINADVGKFFDPLAAAPDFIGVGAGCVLKDKSKCKKNDKPQESSKDKPAENTSKPDDTKTTTAEDKKTTTTDEQKTTTTDQQKTTTTDEQKTTTTGDQKTTTTDDQKTTTTDQATTTTDASATSNTDSASATTTTTDDSSACATTTTAYASAATTAVSVCKVSPEICKNPDDLELADFLDDVDVLERRDNLEKRSSSRPFNIALPNDEEIKMSSIPYVERPKFVEELRITTDKDLYTKVFDYSDTKLDTPKCGPQPLPTGKDVEKFAVEHILELQTMKDFVKYALVGDISVLDSRSKKWTDKIPSSGVTALGTKVIPKDYFLKPWTEPILAGKGLGKIGKGTESQDVPSQRVFEALGSKSNKAAFLLLNSEVNSMKALIWGRKRGMEPREYKTLLAASANPSKYSDSGRVGTNPGSVELVSEWMSTFRLVVGVFQYLNHKETKSRLWEELASVRAEMVNIENNGPASGVGIVALWDNFVPAYFQRIEEKTKEWYDKYLKDARTTFEKAKKDFDDDKTKRQKQCSAGKRPRDEPTPQYIEFTLKTIAKYEKMSSKLKIPREKDLNIDSDLDLPADDAADGTTASTPDLGGFVQAGLSAQVDAMTKAMDAIAKVAGTAGNAA